VSDNLLQVLQESHGVPVVCEGVHVCDREAIVGRCGKENDGKRVAPGDEGDETEGASVPRSDDPTASSKGVNAVKVSDGTHD
jgi:hypothetical protein